MEILDLVNRGFVLVDFTDIEQPGVFTVLEKTTAFSSFALIVADHGLNQVISKAVGDPANRISLGIQYFFLSEEAIFTGDRCGAGTDDTSREGSLLGLLQEG